MASVTSVGVTSATKFVPYWVAVIDDPNFVPTETEQWRFLMTVGTGSVVGKNVILSANLPWLQQDFLIAGYTSLDTPVVFSNVDFPHADPTTADEADLVEWFGADYTKHVVEQFALETKNLTDEQKAAREAARAERIAWRNSVNDRPAVLQSTATFSDDQ